MNCYFPFPTKRAKKQLIKMADNIWSNGQKAKTKIFLNS